MKSYLMLLLAVCFAVFTSANADEPYYYGDGTQAFVLQKPTDLTRAIDPLAGPILITGEREVPLTESLGLRGDTIYQDENGETVLRKSLSHSATYYENADDMGQPVLRGRDEGMATAIAPGALLLEVDEWDKAFEYKGRALSSPPTLTSN